MKAFCNFKCAGKNLKILSMILPAFYHSFVDALDDKHLVSNITYTGEKFLNRKLLPKDVLEYYDSVYGTKSNPHPKRIAFFEESGIVQFGKNTKHTEATTLQQKIHIWQKEKGIRK